MQTPTIIIIIQSSSKNLMLEQVKEKLATVFTPAYVAGLARLLINQYLILRPADLEAWEDTPEEYLQVCMLTLLSSLLTLCCA